MVAVVVDRYHSVPDPEVLKLPPPFGDNQLALGLAEGIPTIAAYVGQIPFGIRNPVEYGRREYVVAEPGEFRFHCLNNRCREKHWWCLLGTVITAEFSRLTLDHTLQHGIIVQLVSEDGLLLKEPLIDA